MQDPDPVQSIEKEIATRTAKFAEMKRLWKRGITDLTEEDLVEEVDNITKLKRQLPVDHLLYPTNTRRIVEMRAIRQSLLLLD
jgi:hypothetical protein